MSDLIRMPATVREITRAPNGKRRAIIAVNDDIGDGMPIDLRNLDLSEYRANPIVLFGHDRWEAPAVVGRSPDVGFDSMGQMVAELEFLPGDERANKVKNAWDRGFLRGASIGALPKPEGGHKLVEWSIVPIPADPDAVSRSLNAVFDDLFTEGDRAMKPDEVKRMIDDALSGNGAQASNGAIDTAALARSLAEGLGQSVEATVADALKQRDDAAEATRAAQEKAAQEKADADQRVADAQAAAEARADVLVMVRSANLLPADFGAKGRTVKEILVAAAGDEVQDADKRSEDYLLAKVEEIAQRRSEAKANAPGATRQASTPTQRAAKVGVTGGAPVTAFDLFKIEGAR